MVLGTFRSPSDGSWSFLRVLLIYIRHTFHSPQYTCLKHGDRAFTQWCFRRERSWTERALTPHRARTPNRAFLPAAQSERRLQRQMEERWLDKEHFIAMFTRTL